MHRKNGIFKKGVEIFQMKSGLLRNPRATIPGLHEWPQVVDSTGYDTRLITDHFKRVFVRKE